MGAVRQRNRRSINAKFDPLVRSLRGRPSVNPPVSTVNSHENRVADQASKAALLDYLGLPPNFEALGTQGVRGRSMKLGQSSQQSLTLEQNRPGRRRQALPQLSQEVFNKVFGQSLEPTLPSPPPQPQPQRQFHQPLSFLGHGNEISASSIHPYPRGRYVSEPLPHFYQPSPSPAPEYVTVPYTWFQQASRGRSLALYGMPTRNMHPAMFGRQAPQRVPIGYDSYELRYGHPRAHHAHRGHGLIQPGPSPIEDEWIHDEPELYEPELGMYEYPQALYEHEPAPVPQARVSHAARLPKHAYADEEEDEYPARTAVPQRVPCSCPDCPSHARGNHPSTEPKHKFVDHAAVMDNTEERRIPLGEIAMAEPEVEMREVADEDDNDDGFMSGHMPQPSVASPKADRRSAAPPVLPTPRSLFQHTQSSSAPAPQSNRDVVHPFKENRHEYLHGRDQEPHHHESPQLAVPVRIPAIPRPLQVKPTSRLAQKRPVAVSESDDQDASPVASRSYHHPTDTDNASQLDLESIAPSTAADTGSVYSPSPTPTHSSSDDRVASSKWSNQGNRAPSRNIRADATERDSRARAPHTGPLAPPKPQIPASSAAPTKQIPAAPEPQSPSRARPHTGPRHTSYQSSTGQKQSSAHAPAPWVQQSNHVVHNLEKLVNRTPSPVSSDDPLLLKPSPPNRNKAAIPATRHMSVAKEEQQKVQPAAMGPAAGPSRNEAVLPTLMSDRQDEQENSSHASDRQSHSDDEDEEPFEYDDEIIQTPRPVHVGPREMKRASEHAWAALAASLPALGHTYGSGSADPVERDTPAPPSPALAPIDSGGNDYFEEDEVESITVFSEGDKSPTPPRYPRKPSLQPLFDPPPLSLADDSIEEPFEPTPPTPTTAKPVKRVRWADEQPRFADPGFQIWREGY